MLPFLKEGKKNNGGREDKNNRIKKLNKCVVEREKSTVVSLEVKNSIQENLQDLINSLKDFNKLEVKLVEHQTYRVNLVCLYKGPRDMIPRFGRPYSYYVVTNEDGSYNFNPPIMVKELTKL